jgi:hypothetical protein
MQTHTEGSTRTVRRPLSPAITLAPTNMPDDGDVSTADLVDNAPSSSFVWGAIAMSMALLFAGVWLQG